MVVQQIAAFSCLVGFNTRFYQTLCISVKRKRWAPPYNNVLKTSSHENSLQTQYVNDIFDTRIKNLRAGFGYFFHLLYRAVIEQRNASQARPYETGIVSNIGSNMSFCSTDTLIAQPSSSNQGTGFSGTVRCQRRKDFRFDRRCGIRPAVGRARRADAAMGYCVHKPIRPKTLHLSKLYILCFQTMLQSIFLYWIS